MSEARFLKIVVKLLERQPALAEQLARVVSPLRQLTEYSGWPVSVVTTDFTRKGRLQAIRDSSNPYGRCVYYCDNDVVDHQHVNIEFENGVTATLIMHGHSYAEGRTIRIDGSKATLIGEMYLHRQRIELFDKQTGRKRILLTEGLRLGNAAHGGGDAGLMSAFAALIRGDWKPAAAGGARSALESHLMAFAAEQARTEGKVVEMAVLR
jgi:predicted dehydrogenase